MTYTFKFYHFIAAMLINGNWEKLPSEDILPSKSSKMNENEGRSNLRFKCFIIIQMIFIWTSYTIIVRYSRSSTPKHLVCNMVIRNTEIYLSLGIVIKYSDDRINIHCQCLISCRSFNYFEIILFISNMIVTIC